jgi:hypothetical protein
MEDFINKAPDKTRPRTFLYKKDSKPMMVYEEEASQYYGQGWYDTPAAFFNMKEHGVPEEKIPELHKEMKDIKEMVNDEINLDALGAPELKAYAKKYLPGLEFYKNANKKTMLRLIKAAKKDIEAEEEAFLSDKEFEVDNVS